MGKLRLSKWWGLYALVPLMIALMVIDLTVRCRRRGISSCWQGLSVPSARWRFLGLTGTLGWSSAAEKAATLPYRRRMSRAGSTRVLRMNGNLCPSATVEWTTRGT